MAQELESQNPGGVPPKRSERFLFLKAVRDPHSAAQRGPIGRTMQNLKGFLPARS